jgi:hypothetical protein
MIWLSFGMLDEVANEGLTECRIQLNDSTEKPRRE